LCCAGKILRKALHLVEEGRTKVCKGGLRIWCLYVMEKAFEGVLGFCLGHKKGWCLGCSCRGLYHTSLPLSDFVRLVVLCVWDLVLPLFSTVAI